MARPSRYGKSGNVDLTSTCSRPSPPAIAKSVWVESAELGTNDDGDKSRCSGSGNEEHVKRSHKMATRRVHGIGTRLITDIAVGQWMHQGISFTRVMTRIRSGLDCGTLGGCWGNWRLGRISRTRYRGRIGRYRTAAVRRGGRVVESKHVVKDTISAVILRVHLSPVVVRLSYMMG